MKYETKEAFDNEWLEPIADKEYEAL